MDAVLLGPSHPLYAAVDEELMQTLSAAVGGTALFIDPLAGGPYRLHFFEISIKGKDTRGNDVLLHAEVVAVREEGGQFEAVPADVLIDLAPHPRESSMALKSRAGEGSMALQSRAGTASDMGTAPFCVLDRTGTALESHATMQPAADHLKSTHQIEARQRGQQDRQQYAAVVRD